MKYADYILSDAWYAKREEKFRQVGKRCQVCGTSDGVIQVHHIHYAHLFNEPLHDLIVLCDYCHSQFHSENGEYRIKKMVYKITDAQQVSKRHRKKKKKHRRHRHNHTDAFSPVVPLQTQDQIKNRREAALEYRSRRNERQRSKNVVQ